uniref:Uncharacterized protein n=1 Tax=Anopheles atroparvus TaxID=41427 RepID=A0A182JBD9_ANOAO
MKTTGDFNEAHALTTPSRIVDGLGPTVGVGLLGALLFAVAVGRLDQVLVDFADRHRRPEEGAGLGAGKVHRHVQLLRLDRLQLELLVLVDEDGCVLGAAVLQLGDQLGLQALVGGVVVVAVELVDVADDGLALVADGPLLDLGCRPLLLALEQGDQRLQDLLQLTADDLASFSLLYRFSLMLLLLLAAMLAALLLLFTAYECILLSQKADENSDTV